MFREFAVVDLSRFREGRLGLRWRTEAEVRVGKGQFSCGAKRCTCAEGLATFEVPFAYEEAGEAKQALVKLRLCLPCSRLLNHKKDQQTSKARREAEETEEEADVVAAGEPAREAAVDEAAFWSGEKPAEAELSREADVDAYLAAMFA